MDPTATRCRWRRRSCKQILSWSASEMPRPPETTTRPVSYVLGEHREQGVMEYSMRVLTPVQGKFIEVQFNNAGYISGAKIQSCKSFSSLFFVSFSVLRDSYLLQICSRSLGLSSRPSVKERSTSSTSCLLVPHQRKGVCTAFPLFTS